MSQVAMNTYYAGVNLSQVLDVANAATREALGDANESPGTFWASRLAAPVRNAVSTIPVKSKRVMLGLLERLKAILEAGIANYASCVSGRGLAKQKQALIDAVRRNQISVSNLSDQTHRFNNGNASDSRLRYYLFTLPGLKRNTDTAQGPRGPMLENNSDLQEHLLVVHFTPAGVPIPLKVYMDYNQQIGSDYTYSQVLKINDKPIERRSYRYTEEANEPIDLEVQAAFSQFRISRRVSRTPETRGYLEVINFAQTFRQELLDGLEQAGFFRQPVPGAFEQGRQLSEGVDEFLGSYLLTRIPKRLNQVHGSSFDQLLDSTRRQNVTSVLGNRVKDFLNGYKESAEFELGRGHSQRQAQLAAWKETVGRVNAMQEQAGEYLNRIAFSDPRSQQLVDSIIAGLNSLKQSKNFARYLQDINLGLKRAAT